jgi:hypothetical protein
MIHWKIQGGALHQGFSFYHPSDETSAGFVLKIGTRIWRVRYSKLSKKWFFSYVKSTSDNF